MNKYDFYKDTGVKWIGEIPIHWDLYLGSFLGEFSKGKGIKKDEVTETGLPCLRYGEIYTHYDLKFTTTRSFINPETSEESVSHGYGTLFLTGSGEKPEEIGKCVVYLGRDPIWVGGDIIVLKPTQEFNPLFLSYLINSESIRIQREISSKGEIVVHIYSKNFREMRYPIPPLSEQLEIVSYLDTKTSQIDSLIEKTQRKIQLLKEKRTSLINEVVTKGLNSNVEMKDSGVEWIGEIPIHWDLRKGSTIGNYSKGNGIKKDEVRETGLPCIRYGEIYTKYNHKFDRVETFIDEGITDVKVSKGTLFMTGSGELLEDIGKCVVYVGEEELYVGGDIIILKPFSEFDSEFLSYQINSECIRIQREINGRGGIIVHIYSKNFKDMWFPTPSLSEQQEIVSYLDEHTQLIDKTVSIEERRIELLKEYRQSLISEVVTGKRKVVNDE